MAWELTGNTGIDPTTNFIGTTDNQPLVIKTKGTEQLRIDPTGNVGIGTTTPGATVDIQATNSNADGLHIVGGANAHALRIANHDEGYTILFTGAGRAVIYQYDTNPFYLNSNTGNIYLGANGSGSQALTITSTGNIGIGTNSPTAQLEVDADSKTAVYGHSNTGDAVAGFSATGTGVTGNTLSGIGVYGKGGQHAGYFEGNVTVTGDVILPGADCAEEFDVAETVEIEPGTVMVLDQDGALSQSRHAYDKRVAGVISGAGEYKAGLILDRQQARDHRLPVALVGKVFCKVDAEYAPIAVGDLLTTSPTPGHAMKADDPLKAFGSVIGKALRSLETGRGLVPILIALQ